MTTSQESRVFCVSEIKMSLPRRNMRRPRLGTFKRLEELVTCTVCLELFKNPKMLPCHHTFCHDCIVKLFEHKNELVCPECRAPVDVRSSDIVFIGFSFL